MNLRYYLRGLGIGILVTATVMSISASGKQEKLSDAEIRERARALGMIEESTVLSSLADESSDEADADAPAADGEAGENPEEALPETAPDGVSGEVLPGEESADTNEGTRSAGGLTGADDAALADERLPDAFGGPQSAKASNSAIPASLRPKETPDRTAEASGTPDEASGVTTAVGTAGGTPSPEQSPLPNAAEVTINIISGDGSYTVASKLAEAGLVSSAAEYDAYLCQNGYDKRLRVGTYNIAAGLGQEAIAKIISGSN